MQQVLHHTCTHEVDGAVSRLFHLKKKKCIHEDTWNVGSGPGVLVDVLYTCKVCIIVLIYICYKKCKCELLYMNIDSEPVLCVCVFEREREK